jgi:hypothetical protein
VSKISNMESNSNNMVSNSQSNTYINYDSNDTQESPYSPQMNRTQGFSTAQTNDEYFLNRNPAVNYIHQGQGLQANDNSLPDFIPAYNQDVNYNTDTYH